MTYTAVTLGLFVALAAATIASGILALVDRWRAASARLDADLAYLARVEDAATDTLARAEAERRAERWEAHVARTVLRVKGEGEQ